MQTYAIGDIHGHLDKLRAAHDLIEADRSVNGDRDAPVVHVGDLVDRGPDSRGVIGFLRSGILGGAPWIVLLGNHDRMFAGFLGDPDYHDPGLRADLHWFDPRLGGAETLASYGVADARERLLFNVHREAVGAVPDEHGDFLHGLARHYRRGEALFVHAGIRPGVPLARQSEDDLVWIRRGFLDDPGDHGALIVHGHTAIGEATHYGNRLNIDSSVAYGGSLSAVVIEGREAWLLTPDGRVPVARGRPGAP
jgi:serine/threonine protein phosphatase 1